MKIWHLNGLSKNVRVDNKGSDCVVIGASNKMVFIWTAVKKNVMFCLNNSVLAIQLKRKKQKEKRGKEKLSEQSKYVRA